MFNMTNNTNDLNTKTAVYAGGCFWCTESDLRKVPGVVDVISGYVGEARPDGSLPSYENHNGFREAVRVIYDPVATNFKKLTQFFLDHIDPTDAGGQFYDRGSSYKTAIYYQSPEEKTFAESLLKELDESAIYEKPAVVDLLPESSFFNAEEYHQKYAEKNPDHYSAYKKGSGRADFEAKTCSIRDQKGINWRD